MLKGFTFIAGPGTHIEKARHIVNTRFSPAAKPHHYGTRKVLAILSHDLLMKEAHRKHCSASETYVFQRRLSVAHSGLGTKLKGISTNAFMEGDAGVLFTSQRFIHGAKMNFLPVLVFVDTPALFDELLDFIYWYSSLWQDAGDAATKTPGATVVAPRIEVCYHKTTVHCVEHFQRSFKNLGVNIELPHKQNGFEWK